MIPSATLGILRYYSHYNTVSGMGTIDNSISQCTKHIVKNYQTNELTKHDSLIIYSNIIKAMTDLKRNGWYYIIKKLNGENK